MGIPDRLGAGEKIFSEPFVRKAGRARLRPSRGARRYHRAARRAVPRLGRSLALPRLFNGLDQRLNELLNAAG